MKKFKFSVTVELLDDFEESAIQKIQTYCQMANLYYEKYQNMSMRFVLHGLDGEEFLETDGESSIPNGKILDIKNLN